MFGLPSITSFLIVGALSALLSGAGIGVVVHKFDLAKLEKVELGYKDAQAQALKVALDKKAKDDQIVLDAAMAEAKAQPEIIIQTQTVTKEVPHYVHDTKFVGCIPNGFVRVLDAEVLGVAPDSVPGAAGKSDDACSTITPSDLASAIIANYGIAKQNAEQLNALEATVRSTAK